MPTSQVTNKAINPILGLFVGHEGRATRALARTMRIAYRNLAQQEYKNAALLVGRGFSRYLWTNASTAQKVARIGAIWAGLDIASRLAGPGGMLYDDYGRFNIAGVPFI